jgi:hypothetical protein
MAIVGRPGGDPTLRALDVEGPDVVVFVVVVVNADAQGDLDPSPSETLSARLM